MILLVAAGGPSQDLVLCIADEGHVDVETAFDACCTAAPSNRVDTTTASLLPDAPCGGCTDIALGTTRVETTYPRLNQPSFGLTWVAASRTGPRTAVTRFTRNSEAAPDVGDPSPTWLRTIILLS